MLGVNVPVPLLLHTPAFVYPLTEPANWIGVNIQTPVDAFTLNSGNLIISTVMVSLTDGQKPPEELA